MNQDRLSPGQRRVARFCLSQPTSASELAAARIGSIIGVGESTVVRLALRLGYDGFPELQQAIRETLKSGSLADASTPDRPVPLLPLERAVDHLPRLYGVRPEHLGLAARVRVFWRGEGDLS